MGLIAKGSLKVLPHAFISSHRIQLYASCTNTIYVFVKVNEGPLVATQPWQKSLWQFSHDVGSVARS